MRLPLALSLFCCIAPSAQAQAQSTETASGYVVGIESGSVYLDLGENAGAAAGQPFFIYTEGAELKHPVSGQVLGRLENAVAEGRVKLVLPKYAVGALLQGGGEVKSGMRARLGRPQPAPAAPASAAQPQTNATPLRPARWKSPPFNFAIAGIAVADFAGDGKQLLAIADKKTVSLFPYPPKDSQPLAQFSHPGTGPRIISLSAGDFNGNGRAELFATLYNETFTRVETLVLELTDGKWVQLADIPWMVRSYQDPEGKPVLAMQQLVEDQTFPFSNIYRLTFKDGRYGPGKDAIRFKRVDFLFDFTQANLDGGKDPALLYLTNTNHVRVQFKEGYWKTPESYGQTPSRLRWHSRLLEFHPQIPVLYDAGKATVFLSRNTSMLGSLSEPFGLFNGGIIERQSWNGVALAADWKADLGGYTTAMALVPAANPTDLAVAVTGTSGKSAIWIFDP